jgi:hypothetical protein
VLRPYRETRNAKRETLRSFNVYLQEVNFGHVQFLKDLIQCRSPNRNTRPICYAVAEVMLGVLDSVHRAPRRRDGSMDRDHIVQTVVVDEFLQTAEGSRMSFDTENGALVSHGSGKR